MAYSATCCGCIELRSGCLFIGYLQVISKLIVTAFIMFCMIVTGVKISDFEGKPKSDVVHWTGIITEHSNMNHDNVLHDLTLVMIIQSVVLLLVIVSLAFTITLLVGIHQHKRGHIKAYLIFAFIFVVIGVIGLCLKLSFNPTDILPYHTIVILVKIFFLSMIRRYYISIGDVKRLVDTETYAEEDCSRCFRFFLTCTLEEPLLKHVYNTSRTSVLNTNTEQYVA